MTAPTTADELTVLAIVRGFAEYDDTALLALWKTVDIEDIAIGLEAIAATFAVALAEARGITPQELIDQHVRAAIDAAS